MPSWLLKYPKLTEDEIKTLVVDDKWVLTLIASVRGEMNRVSQTLTSRIQQLAERYVIPLPADLPTKWPRSHVALMNSSRKWEWYGTEARLQGDGVWNHS